MKAEWSRGMQCKTQSMQWKSCTTSKHWLWVALAGGWVDSWRTKMTRDENSFWQTIHIYSSVLYLLLFYSKTVPLFVNTLSHPNTTYISNNKKCPTPTSKYSTVARRHIALVLLQFLSSLHGTPYILHTLNEQRIEFVTCVKRKFPKEVM
jgi:hypothetical protein